MTCVALMPFAITTGNVATNRCGLRSRGDAACPLRAWVRMVRRKHYRQDLEVRADFPTADFVGPRRVIFNVCGNAYRLVVDLRYDLGRAYIRHIVTHDAYARLIKRGAL